MQRRRLLIVACALAASGCVPRAPRSAHVSSPLSAPKEFVHKAAGYRFPVRVNDYIMVDVKQYDDKGEDSSVGYDNITKRIAVTFYVYPKQAGHLSDTLKNHFAFCCSEVVRENPGAKLLGTAQATALVRGKKSAVYRALYDLKNGEKHSEVFLSEDGPWYVLIRSTYPTKIADEASRSVDEFIHDFPCPKG